MNDFHIFSYRPARLFLILNSIFLTFLIMAEVTGAKLISFSRFTLTMGVIPFPVTFIVTDLLNEYYGRRGVRFTTLLGMVMILLAYLVIAIDLQIPAVPDSPVDDASFKQVFANSGYIIIGSITAYLIGQMVDIQIFHYIRKMTGGEMIWLRATGSTIVSQLIDSFVVIFIAFGQYMAIPRMAEIASINFVYKLGIAILITPIIYLAHYWMDRYLKEHAEPMRRLAMEEKARLE